MTRHSLVKSSKSNEWYTPLHIIEAARQVLGRIDLDPASCRVANETVQATHYYSREDDGLCQKWRGKIWLNPPYSSENEPRGMYGGIHISLVGRWIDHLIKEFHRGNVEEAILLIKSDPKQRWFLPLWEFLICFAHDRILFNRPGLPPEKHQFGTAFVYLGPNKDQFINVFQRLGTIAKKVAAPPISSEMEEEDCATQSLEK
jgi:ParB family chromosome partitioning protein